MNQMFLIFARITVSVNLSIKISNLRKDTCEFGDSGTSASGYWSGKPLLPASLHNRSAPVSDTGCPGATPGKPANHSPLAQNQSGSLTNCGRRRVTSTGYQFPPLGVEASTSVSDTERAGALPAAATNFRRGNQVESGWGQLVPTSALAIQTKS